MKKLWKIITGYEMFWKNNVKSWNVMKPYDKVMKRYEELWNSYEKIWNSYEHIWNVMVSNEKIKKSYEMIWKKNICFLDLCSWSSF